ncbi:sigma-70 family RNA polymerase sigma factor [Bacillus mycoides]|uniref:sigma-70 family RNA polymerase sigma factor n=1 Tax=Bacillus mycoides TaxID=1405 RepID=UPI003D1B2D0E
MTPEELFEEKQHLVIAAIKQRFGSMLRAKQIAEMNNMELDDLIQVGRMQLWELCLKYNPEKVKTFKKYTMTHMKWRMSDEIHTKGTPFKVTRWTNAEERNQIDTQSIDLHKDGEIATNFFAVSPIDVEKEAMVSIQYQEAMSVLNEEEKIILTKKVYGFTDDEIADEIGKSRQIINKKKNRAFKKINPDYKRVIKKELKKKKNHLLQQVI